MLSIQQTYRIIIGAIKLLDLKAFVCNSSQEAAPENSVEYHDRFSAPHKEFIFLKQ